MARIIIPDAFAAQRTLLGNIQAKDTADGAGSVLKQFLTENGIVLADEVQAGINAQVFEDARSLLTKQAKNYTQLRDTRIEPVKLVLKKSGQFFKKLFVGNVTKMGEWGFNITPNGRIILPADFDEWISLWNTFYDKYESFDPDPTPLDNFLNENNIDLDDINTRAGQANTNNASAKAASEAAEDDTEKRDELWLPVVANIHKMANFLFGMYPSNPRALGLWGITVDSSKRKPKVVTTTLKLSETKTINTVIIGGTLTNLGPGDIHVYTGKTTIGNPTIVHHDEKLGIAKGMSIITVANPSALESVKFKVLRGR